MDLKQTLGSFGLEGKKADVYLVALQLGSASAQEIAKRAGLKRPTVVEVLEGLVRRGLMSVVTEKRTRMFAVEPQRKLLAQAEEQERQARLVLTSLEALYGKSRSRPSVQFYEGIEGIKTVYEDTLTASKKKLRGILSMRDLYEVPGKTYMDDYIKRRIDAGITLQVVRSEQKDIEKTWNASRKELRELHLAPAEMIFAMTMYLYDDKVALIGTQKENFGLIIHSQDFFVMQSHLFETLWQVTRVAKAIDG